MIIAEVEIDNNSNLEYFKSLQSKAWPTALLVIIPHPIEYSETLIFLKIEPSLTDTIFILVNKKTEEFKGYVWLKKLPYRNYYKLINYQFFLDELLKDNDFNYPINILGKIIKDGYDMQIEDNNLIEQMILYVPRIKLDNGIIKSNQNYFDSTEGLIDMSNEKFNTQYIKWFYHPNKYMFWPGKIINFIQ
jgi:hypothetical protein